MDEKISYRTIGVMAIICLLLLGYLIWMPLLSEHSGPVGTFITEGASVRQINRLSISTPDGRSFHYQKTAEQWMMSAPYRVAANETMIQGLLEAVGNTRIMEIVEKHPDNLSEYGLGEDQRMTVAVEFEDGTAQTFRIGARLPLNQIYVYFQREGDPSIFRAWEGLRLILEKDAAVLDQGRPVQFNSADVVSLDLTGGDRSLHLEKREKNWLITRPLQRAAASQAVQSYLELIRSLTSSGVYPAGEISEKKLSDSGNLRLILNNSQGKGTIILQLAAEDSTTPPLLFIEQEGQSTIYKTDPGAMEKLSFSPDDFFLSNALLFDKKAINVIEVSHPRYTLGLFRDSDGSWVFHHPYEGQRADADMVGQLLYLLGHMPVEQYLETESGTGDSTKASIIIKLSGKMGSMSLRIAQSPGGPYRGTSELHPNWFRLDSDKVKQLTAFAPEDLVDRYLLVYDPRSVEQVIVRRGKNNYVLTKQGRGWEWEKPERKKARSAAAWKLVFGIRDLQYLKPAGEHGTTLVAGDDCGTDDPDVVIRVLQAGAEPVGEIRMNASRPGNDIFVSSSRLPGCYRIDRTAIDQLLPGPADLADDR